MRRSASRRLLNKTWLSWWGSPNYMANSATPVHRAEWRDPKESTCRVQMLYAKRGWFCGDWERYAPHDLLLGFACVWELSNPGKNPYLASSSCIYTVGMDKSFSDWVVNWATNVWSMVAQLQSKVTQNLEKKCDHNCFSWKLYWYIYDWLCGLSLKKSKYCGPSLGY